MKFISLLLFTLLLVSCGGENSVKENSVKKKSAQPEINRVKPVIVTDKVEFDSDDPAIWINREKPSESLVLGTDKNMNGNVFVFDMKGKIVKKIAGIKRPNNIDVEYDFMFKGEKIDIAVVTERHTSKLRIYKLPEMVPVDGGGVPVFENEEIKSPMGIALYRREDGDVFAVVSRKGGPAEGYLFQYLLKEESGIVKGSKVRAFGAYCGTNEVEAIVVDDEMGYVYYSDESYGVRKYHADPAHPQAAVELAAFALKDIKEDREGLSIYDLGHGKGYILVSDQAANRFHVYSREGSEKNPHEHKLIKIVDVSTNNSDGSETVSVPLGKEFPSGIFIAMSDDRTFQYYRWEDIAGEELKVLK